MSTQIPSPSPRSREQSWMNGYTVFAVTVLLVLGLWQFLAGLTAVVRDGLWWCELRGTGRLATPPRSRRYRLAHSGSVPALFDPWCDRQESRDRRTRA